MIRVCLAGISGWAGSALAQGIAKADDLQLATGVSRTNAGTELHGARVFATAAEALGKEVDVFVEYTKPDIAKDNIIAALGSGTHVVVGTSGLSDTDYEEIDSVAKANNLGVVAAGNFAITAALAAKFAKVAARYVDHREVIDYAHEGKIDSPSGTAREVAWKISTAGETKLAVPIESTKGAPESRGVKQAGVQVHSVRLPGYVLAVEALFGKSGEKLSIRHEAGESAEPYVDGALLAIRNVGKKVGLVRGLDELIEF